MAITLRTHFWQLLHAFCFQTMTSNDIFQTNSSLLVLICHIYYKIKKKIYFWVKTGIIGRCYCDYKMRQQHVCAENVTNDHTQLLMTFGGFQEVCRKYTLKWFSCSSHVNNQNGRYQNKHFSGELWNCWLIFRHI